MKKKAQREGAKSDCHLENPSYIFITFVSNPFSFPIPQITGFGANDWVCPIHFRMKSQLGFILTTLEYVRVLCLCYSKKLSQVYTKQEEFCFSENSTAGFLYAENHCYTSSLSLSHSWNKGFSDNLYVF